MRLTLKGRQTFIALRARRQAHQIAREILNPPLEVDQPPPFARPADFVPARDLGPLVSPDLLPHERWFLVVSIGIFLGLIVCLSIVLLSQ